MNTAVERHAVNIMYDGLCTAILSADIGNAPAGTCLAPDRTLNSCLRRGTSEESIAFLWEENLHSFSSLNAQSTAKIVQVRVITQFPPLIAGHR